MSEIVFGWPPRECSPNWRGHWSKKAKAAKAYKTACWALALEAGAKVDWDGDVHLWITFFPPDRRARDDDNIIASAKYLLEGLALALGSNDKRFRLHPWVSDEIGGMVKVRLSRGAE